MAQYLELDAKTLIDFANGTPIGGYTITTPASPTITETGKALETITSTGNGWSVAFKVISGSQQIYTITHA